MPRDPWLSKWLPVIAERARPDPVLEIGCGIGDDTETLISAGLSVVAFDVSEQAVAAARARAPAARIHEALRPRGILVSRLNSTEDHHYGASGHAEIETHYYLVDGRPKRFFDRAALDALFVAGWTQLSVQHAYTTKYERPKALWEVVVERDA